MGIPYYFYVICRAHDGILRSTPPANIQELYMDFNGAVYQAVHKLAAAGAVVTGAPTQVNDESVCAETMAYLSWLVDTVKPKGEVGVCLDGVAPRAKMVQQRKRRYMGMFDKALRAKSDTDAWDTCAISPGTPFMATLAATLRAYVTTVPWADRAWVSPADEPGEGEHKIFKRLSRTYSGAATIIYGLDADLIMLSLVAHRPDIYLMREPQQQAKGTAPTADSVASNSPFLYVDITALRRGILSDVHTHYGWPVDAEAMADPFHTSADVWIETYIVLCFLLGNDFIPALPAMTFKEAGLESILRAYGRVLASAAPAPLVDPETATIDWHTFGLVLEELVAEEGQRVFEACQANLQRRCHARTPEERVEFFPLLPENRDPVAVEIGSGKCKDWYTTYYAGLFSCTTTPIHKRNIPTLIRDSTRSYLQGCAWVYRYYKQMHKDPKWYYPWGYAPSIRDLTNTVKAEGAALRELVAGWKAPGGANANAGDSEWVKPTTQLLCILPPTSRALLPPRYQEFMTSPADGCMHFYKSDFHVHTFLKTRLWECHPMLPILDVDWIEGRVARA